MCISATAHVLQTYSNVYANGQHPSRGFLIDKTMPQANRTERSSPYVPLWRALRSPFYGFGLSERVVWAVSDYLKAWFGRYWSGPALLSQSLSSFPQKGPPPPVSHRPSRAPRVEKVRRHRPELRDCCIYCRGLKNYQYSGPMI